MSRGAKISWEQAVAWLRAQPDQEWLVKACYFDDPLLEAAQRFHASVEWQAVRKYLSRCHGTALDVGAGRGIASYALALDGWRVTALEPDPSQLVGAGAIQALAHESGADITIVEEWGERLPFAEASFDVVHARQVLHHARNLKELCSELVRVLKPGGLLIATREHVIDKEEDLPAFLQTHPLHHLYGGENAFTLAQYLGALRGAGLKLTHILSPWETPINYFPLEPERVRQAVIEELDWRWPSWLPAYAVRKASRRLSNPGRHFTFIGRRPRYFWGRS